MVRKASERRLQKHPLFVSLGKATELEPGVSAMAQETYHLRLMRLEDMTSLPLEELILKPKQTYGAVSAKHLDSATTRKGYTTAVLSLFAHNPEFSRQHSTAHDTWKLIHRSDGGLEAVVRKDNRLTAEKREKMTSVPRMRAAARKLKKKIKTQEQSQHYLLLRFMTEVPPKRADLGELLVCKQVPKAYDGNYVLVPSKGDAKLVLQQYKTMKAYGVITDVLPKSLAADLKASLEAYPRQYVFQQATGEPMTPSQYGAYVRAACLEHTGKASGINDIRHAYISDTCIASKLTYTELEAIARSMGHSVGMQSQYQLVGWKAGGE